MPQPLIVPTNEATKISHPFSGSDGSPTDSVGNSISSHSDTSRKRKRSLDYTPAQLSEMEYVTLNTESFDIVPGKVPSHTLPDANMPLHDRLHQIYADRTQKDKASRARGFFASLTIDQYEECGDLLLDGFKNVMERLKQARQQKRKAARMMEEQVAQREEWVRKKRGVCEMELGRLRSAGSAVVKPVKSR